MGKPKAPKSTSTINQTQTATPWAPAAPALQQMIDSAQTAYGATPKTPVYTGPNATQLQAVDLIKNFAPQAGAGFSPLLENAQKTAGGFYTSGEGKYQENINPYLQQVIGAAINPLRDQLDANVLSIGDAAKLAGAYGGDRGDLLKGTALSRFNRDAMDVGAQVSYQATEAERNRGFQSLQAERARQMEAARLFSEANQIGMAPGMILGDLGEQQATWDLAAATAAMDAPWAGLDRYSQVLSGVSPYGTTTTQGTTTTKGSAGGGGLQGGLSGALGGASAGAAFGPWGAGVGAVLGGLGGLFG